MSLKQSPKAASRSPKSPPSGDSDRPASPASDDDEAEVAVAAGNSWKRLDLDLDDAFSTGDESPSAFNIAPPVSFREMAAAEEEEDDGLTEDAEEAQRRSSYGGVEVDDEALPTPTTARGFFAVDGKGEVIEANGALKDHSIEAHMASSIAISPPTSPEVDLAANGIPSPYSATQTLSAHSRMPFQSPDLSTEFVDVSLTSTPASRRPSPGGLPTPATGTTVSSATSAAFLSTSSSDSTLSHASQTSSSAPESTVSAGSPKDGAMATTVSRPILSPPRPSRRRGPSVLESVISQTRPTYLPPKPKSEDRKHLKDWESMMAQARVAEERRKQEAEMRMLEKERRMEEALEIWEREVMPDIHAAARDKKLRRLWWLGVPPKLRGRVWAATVGNPLALSRDSYRPCISRARRALSAGKFPRETLEVIDEDVLHTLPSLRIFDPDHGPMHQDLKDLLYAWTVARGDEGLSYVRGASHVAAMFLINMPAEQAFVAFRNLLDRHCMRAFYAGQNDDMEAYYRIFDTLLADTMPKVYYNFQKHRIPPTRYLPDWLVPLFVLHLPFDAAARIWDIMLLEGDSFLFRAALGVLGVMEGRLYFPDHQELMQVLRGEDGSSGKGKGREKPPEGGRYEKYGVTEESLFARIAEMDAWWKENTWTRLIERELPDL